MVSAMLVISLVVELEEYEALRFQVVLPATGSGVKLLTEMLA